MTQSFEGPESTCLHTAHGDTHMTQKKCWKETASGEMILLRDAAYELGGGNCESVNYTCATSDQELLMENEILLYGEDLPELKQDTSFARIVFLRTDAADNFEGEGGALSLCKGTGICTLSYFPQRGIWCGHQPRASQEQARVSKDAIGSGINFERLGSTYIRKYLKNPRVRNVQVLFLTGMKELEPFLKRGAADGCGHGGAEPYFAGMPMNCKTCDLRRQSAMKWMGCARCTRRTGNRMPRKEKERAMEGNAKVIAVTGKGGVGKTSLAAGMVRRLTQRYPDAKILAIDADPAVGLATALDAKVKETLDDIRLEITQGVSEKLKDTQDILSEARFRLLDMMDEEKGFAFVAIGRPESSGCYCAINSYLRT